MNLEKIYEISCKALSGVLKNGLMNGDKKQAILRAELSRRLPYDCLYLYSPDLQDLIQASITGVLEALDNQESQDNLESLCFEFAFKSINKYLQGERRNSGHKINNIYVSNECFEELLDKELNQDGDALVALDPLSDGSYNITKATRDYIKSLDLTERQTKIAIWLTEGYTEKQIADKLKISEIRVRQIKASIKSDLAYLVEA